MDQETAEVKKILKGIEEAGLTMEKTYKMLGQVGLSETKDTDQRGGGTGHVASARSKTESKHGPDSTTQPKWTQKRAEDSELLHSLAKTDLMIAEKDVQVWTAEAFEQLPWRCSSDAAILSTPEFFENPSKQTLLWLLVDALGSGWRYQDRFSLRSFAFARY